MKSSMSLLSFVRHPGGINGRDVVMVLFVLLLASACGETRRLPPANMDLQIQILSDGTTQVADRPYGYRLAFPAGWTVVDFSGSEEQDLQNILTAGEAWPYQVRQILHSSLETLGENLRVTAIDTKAADRPGGLAPYANIWIMSGKPDTTPDRISEIVAGNLTTTCATCKILHAAGAQNANGETVGMVVYQDLQYEQTFQELLIILTDRAAVQVVVTAPRQAQDFSMEQFCKPIFDSILVVP